MDEVRDGVRLKDGGLKAEKRYIQITCVVCGNWLG